MYFIFINFYIDRVFYLKMFTLQTNSLDIIFIIFFTKKSIILSYENKEGELFYKRNISISI